MVRGIGRGRKTRRIRKKKVIAYKAVLAWSRKAVTIFHNPSSSSVSFARYV